MAEIYRHFGREWDHVLDFSDEMLVEHYNHVSVGTPISDKNGFKEGEKWMDVNVAMWNEDISKGHLPRRELYLDYPEWDWWLDKVLW